LKYHCSKLDESVFKGGFSVEVKSCHLVPTAEVTIVILHQFCEKIDIGILVEKLKIVAFALS
jgi:hypothetical protein